jgi:hypothetical protein
MKDLDKEKIEEECIRISCKDSGILRNTMIGAYAVDATMVYTMNKDHEFYRQWVPLMDDSDPEDVGVQGYLKLSLTVRFSKPSFIKLVSYSVIAIDGRTW